MKWDDTALINMKNIRSNDYDIKIFSKLIASQNDPAVVQRVKQILATDLFFSKWNKQTNNENQDNMIWE